MEEKFFAQLSENKFIDENDKEYSLRDMLKLCFDGKSVDDEYVKECDSIIPIETEDKEYAKEVIASHKLIKKLSEK